jgi:hypothetical protein
LAYARPGRLLRTNDLTSGDQLPEPELAARQLLQVPLPGTDVARTSSSPHQPAGRAAESHRDLGQQTGQAPGDRRPRRQPGRPGRPRRPGRHRASDADSTAWWRPPGRCRPGTPRGSTPRQVEQPGRPRGRRMQTASSSNSSSRAGRGQRGCHVPGRRRRRPPPRHREPGHHNRRLGPQRDRPPAGEGDQIGRSEAGWSHGQPGGEDFPQSVRAVRL